MNHFSNGVPGHLLDFISTRCLEVDFVAPGASMPSVPLAAQAIGVPEDQILKTLLFAGDDGDFVVVIANGTRRIDHNRLARVAAMRNPRPAKPVDVVAVTGFPAGGVAPIGLPESIPVIVDAATAALSFAYGGGGQEHLLLRVRISDVIRCNNALVADIAERPEETAR
jgi:prolyl-tRNA editing enzyme YbaK/EbsC (Cys-tRNA(Pro) deacylase)